MVQVVWAGNSYNGEELSPAEASVLERDVFKNIAGGSSFLRSLFEDNREGIVGAAKIAKAYFKSPFAGMAASDGQFGVQQIRPGHIKRTTAATEAASNTWNFTFTSGAGADWLGYSSNNRTALNIDKELLMLVLGVAFSQGGAPLVEEIRWQVGDRTYPETVIRNAWLADTPSQIRAARTYPMLLLPKDTLLATVTAFQTGDNELVVLGLSFGMGRFLRNTSYSSISL